MATDEQRVALDLSAGERALLTGVLASEATRRKHLIGDGYPWRRVVATHLAAVRALTELKDRLRSGETMFNSSEVRRMRQALDNLYDTRPESERSANIRGALHAVNSAWASLGAAAVVSAGTADRAVDLQVSERADDRAAPTEDEPAR